MNSQYLLGRIEKFQEEVESLKEDLEYIKNILREK